MLIFVIIYLLVTLRNNFTKHLALYNFQLLAFRYCLVESYTLRCYQSQQWLLTIPINFNKKSLLILMHAHAKLCNCKLIKFQVHIVSQLMGAFHI